MIKKMKILKIEKLKAAIEKKSILEGINLSVKQGEIHVIMGPNGSGKSTFAQVLMGNQSYKTHKNSSIKIGRKDILGMSPDERAKAGLFLAFQSPIAISGVTLINLLRSAYQSVHPGSNKLKIMIQNPGLRRNWNADIPVVDFMKKIESTAKFLDIKSEFLYRSVNDGFSGGERKKSEILQALVLKPLFAVFDEIDTGLDVDALKIVAKAINKLNAEGAAIIIITHYMRILKYIKPEFVHILVSGKIVETGSNEVANIIEKQGYSKYYGKKSS